MAGSSGSGRPFGFESARGLLGELPVKASEIGHLEERPVALLLDLAAPVPRGREAPVDARPGVEERIGPGPVERVPEEVAQDGLPGSSTPPNTVSMYCRTGGSLYSLGISSSTRTTGFRIRGTWQYLSMKTREDGTLWSPRWMTADPTQCPIFCWQWLTILLMARYVRGPCCTRLSPCPVSQRRYRDCGSRRSCSARTHSLNMSVVISRHSVRLCST